MKRISLIASFFAIVAIIAVGICFFDNYSENISNKELAGRICMEISPKAQVGGIHDSFDQAYSLLKMISKTKSSYLELKDGSIAYGQRPGNAQNFMEYSCGVKERPDLKLSFFFEKSSIFGIRYLSVYSAVTTAMLAIGLLLIFLATKITSVVKNTLSSEVSRILNLSEESHSGAFGKLLEKILANTPAIKKLKNELQEKSQLASKVTSYQQEVNKLSATNNQFENKTVNTSALVQSIRHDIRSPLSFLKVFGQSLPKNSNAETYQLSVLKIEKIVDELETIDGLKINKEDRAELTLVECSIHEVINSKRMSLTSQKNARFSFDFDKNSLTAIAAPQGRFSRIIDNLLQNSLEAIEVDGQIAIYVKKNKEAVTITISDNGRGIPQEILNRIGDERITFGKSNGNGIGLLTAKQWIDAWGGSFKVESSGGSGAIVTIELPIKSLGAQFVAQVPSLNINQAVIVDDDPQLAKIFLSKSGIQGKVFSSIENYVNWLEDADLTDSGIFSIYDLHLKPGSGLDLLRLHPSPERAMLYTYEYLNPDAIELSAELGFPIYPKPFLETFVNP